MADRPVAVAKALPADGDDGDGAPPAKKLAVSSVEWPDAYQSGSWPSQQLTDSQARRRDRNRIKKAKRRANAGQAAAINFQLKHISQSEPTTAANCTVDSLPRTSTGSRGLPDHDRTAYCFLQEYQGASLRLYVLVGYGYEVFMDSECL